MSKAEKTRQFIIEQTAELFNKKGYAGTSLSDITTATGLTKGSIYGNFENKDEVAKEVYLYNSKRLQTSFINQLNNEMTAREKLFTIIDYYRKTWEINFSRGGCPHLNTAVEADDTMPFLKAEVAKNFENWGNQWSRILEKGKTQKEIVETADSLQYAFQFIALIEGGILLSKTMNNKTYLFNALERIETIIDNELIK
ncbi:TetR/AcrR family transcriptional regulator [Epilithonimonas arachidiradicis]|uniref:Transcriptional regulator n=1 Tax=Epilithonimonas arachidiradicis TaxID=1617282 RepID=A0A420DBS9_9FLAO|nr:TetR/AcrR family transcriptional regulator [Epilithonimonas arachidiradicis]RKE88949.1 TetR family transcriptional regulator [Epilithonimonas arachidiradicis]GGG53760.1 transcriptional regulator [Epilithonimonas arachidiradicis]